MLRSRRHRTFPTEHFFQLNNFLALMYDDTPNKEEIDWIAGRVRDIYNYDELKDCDINYLR